MKGIFQTARDLAPDEEARRSAKRRLVEEARRLVEAVALVATSTV
jgi:hypothetical protein